MNVISPNDYYRARLKNLDAELVKLRSKKSAIGWLRFGSIALAATLFYFLWNLGWIYPVAAATLLLIAFTRLVFADIRTREKITHLEHLIQINKDELLALENNFLHFDDGARFSPKEHPYSNDLDIFGRSSIFQFINRCCGEPGATDLASWLLEAASPETILKRQEAVKELSALPDWRQELQATGKEQPIRFETIERLKKWLGERDRFLGFTHWRWLRYLLPAIILTISALTIFDYLSINVFYGALLIFAIIAFQINKEVAPIHNQLNKIVDEIDVLSGVVAHIEQTNFNASLLAGLHQQFSTDSIKASAALRELKRILDRLDMRYNIAASAPLNLFLLWNLHQVLDLEKWKRKYGQYIPQWFSAAGELEALSSFGNLAFNQPGWCYPEIADQYFTVTATEMGHPLISSDKRVNNPLHIDNRGELMIVTGSNMAGKSTYLRSIGVNTVLAMAGAPVCAGQFRLSHVQVISSMRIADNLEESTSTFYAELKKLKAIIDRVNAGERLFILLDEILRGTNSLDRHTGAVALIKQFLRHKAVCIIATHDVELAKLKESYPPNILNYHFDVQVEKEELYFDYKLKEGICNSLNASILMKKIGIEL